MRITFETQNAETEQWEEIGWIDELKGIEAFGMESDALNIICGMQAIKRQQRCRIKFAGYTITDVSPLAAKLLLSMFHNRRFPLTPAEQAELDNDE